MKFVRTPLGDNPGTGATRSESLGASKAALPRYLEHPASSPSSHRVRMGAPGDRFELEADRIAERFETFSPARSAAASPPSSPRRAATSSTIARSVFSSGRPLDAATRTQMEGRFDVDLSHVRVHTGSQPESLNRDLGSRAFTLGRDIFYGRGQTPGNNSLTAHELVHVVQQGGGSRESAFGPISGYAGEGAIQRETGENFIGTYPVDPNGAFEIHLETRNDVRTCPGYSGMDGYIRFVPDARAPNSNYIYLTQIATNTDGDGNTVGCASLPEEQGKEGRLGEPGLATKEDPARAIKGGYATDALHDSPLTRIPFPPGSYTPPYYPAQPAGPGREYDPDLGLVSQLPKYGGRTGGQARPALQISGFKRSKDPGDIRSAVIYDWPGTDQLTDMPAIWNLETVARGEDVPFTYGSVTWGFQITNGVVSNQHLDVHHGHSPTFDEAVERHRDFYIHEQVYFYFEYGHAGLRPGEEAKIDSILPYLKRKGNRDVLLSLKGFADNAGGEKQNLRLSQMRADSVRAALLKKGVPSGRIAVCEGKGVTSEGSDPEEGFWAADQGGDEALGQDQSREANRWTNRRVILEFERPDGPPDWRWQWLNDIISEPKETEDVLGGYG